MNNVWLALGLTIFAGMGTGIGGGIAFFAKRTNYRFLAIGTGFAAGVMIYISFVEILEEANTALVAAYGEGLGDWVSVASFFAGIAIIGIIDALIPEATNPHHSHEAEARESLQESDEAELGSAEARQQHGQSAFQAGATRDEELLRTGLLTALAIGIHNFPEGLVTFLSALQDPALGMAVAVAVLLHNIPEGVSVSVPIYYATGQRVKAFLYTALSGLFEPIGAGIAYVALRLFVAGEEGVMPPQVIGILFAVVAGIMVYISLDELLPTSRAYGQGHDSLFGLLAGMVIMALTLLLVR